MMVMRTLMIMVMVLIMIVIRNVAVMTMMMMMIVMMMVMMIMMTTTSSAIPYLLISLQNRKHNVDKKWDLATRPQSPPPVTHFLQ